MKELQGVSHLKKSWTKQSPVSAGLYWYWSGNTHADPQPILIEEYGDSKTPKSSRALLPCKCIPCHELDGFWQKAVIPATITKGK